MSDTYIPVALRRAVIARAYNRCEYCLVPDDATLAPHEVDHVVAERHRGTTELANLAYACFRCNRLKGTDLTSIDPQTGQITQLFNPRTDRWIEHFRLDGTLMESRTDIGRTTITFLDFNDQQWQALRAELLRQGRFLLPEL